MGLTIERTALAWQRTALTTAAGAAIMARFVFDRLSVVGVVPLAGALVLSAWIMMESRVRYRHRRSLGANAYRRSAVATLALSVAVSLMALTELAALVDDVARWP